MNPLSPAISAVLLFTVAALGAARPLPAHAAQSYDNCTGFIDSLPATIGTQGTWCLRHDLSTAITNGQAITVAANNVTIDCNDFKIGGLAAGDSSQAYGVSANDRFNTTVRHCNIRGFGIGIWLVGGAGHLVEDNRLDNNLSLGIEVIGANNRVRRNAVYDTGGSPNGTYTIGIFTDADTIDNIIAGVFGTATDTYPVGIQTYLYGDGIEVRGNLIRDLVVAGSGYARGIEVGAGNVRLSDNHLSGEVGTTIPGVGISALSAFDTACIGNTVIGFATAFSGCDHALNNLP